MIEVEDLQKHYGDVRAVDGISFKIRRGEVVGFLGPNGAGKTTTMKVLTTFISPTSGRARIDGLDVMDESLAVRRKVGYLPESAPLYPDMMVLDYLGFVAELRGLAGEEARRKLNDTIERCAIGEVLGKDIGDLSKGYRRRVALAQSLLHEPECLILDEPTEGLDPNQIVEIRELIKGIGRDKTILLSSHILPEVQATCSRVMIIAKGKIVADGTSEELRQQGGAEARLYLKIDLGSNGSSLSIETVRASLASLPMVKKVLDSEGESERIVGFEVRADGKYDVRRDIFQMAATKGYPLLEMRREVVSLEDVFRKVTA